MLSLLSRRTSSEEDETQRGGDEGGVEGGWLVGVVGQEEEQMEVKMEGTGGEWRLGGGMGGIVGYDRKESNLI